MEEVKKNVKRLLAGADQGLTKRQISRIYKGEYGRSVDQNGVNVEKVLEDMADVIRVGRSPWGDLLYFLKSDDGDVELLENDAVQDTVKTAAVKSLRYNAEYEIGKLGRDSRGWYTVCWNSGPAETEQGINERFSAFGSVADVRLDRGKAFVRFQSRDAAEATIRTLGPVYGIEASRNILQNCGALKQQSHPAKSNVNAGDPTSTKPKNLDPSKVTESDKDAEGRLPFEIYVSDLPLDIDEVDLEEMFLNFDVQRIRVNAGKHRRYAFVDLSSREEVEKAMLELRQNGESGRYYLTARKATVRLLPRDPALKSKFMANQDRSEHEITMAESRSVTSHSSSHSSNADANDSNRDKSMLSSADSQESIAGSMSSLAISGEPATAPKLCKHARTPCRNYPNCKPNCDFQHPLCPQGFQCDQRFCDYDHPNRIKKCHLCMTKPNNQMDEKLETIVTKCEHRRTSCSAFPKCPYGARCSFMHPACPEPFCDAWNVCTYEHQGQRKICYICLKAIKEAAKEKEDPEALASWKGSTKSVDANETVSLKDVPCRHGMKCWTPQCPYKHPAEWDKKACPWGRRCHRSQCSFVHPPAAS